MIAWNVTAWPAAPARYGILAGLGIGGSALVLGLAVLGVLGAWALLRYSMGVSRAD